MSEETPPGGKPPKEPPGPPKNEILPKDEAFFNWLESLFAPDQEHFPEKLDVRVVRGRNGTVYGPAVKQYVFTADGKPGKEKLAHISNEILFRVQRDCDASRKETLYHVAAIHYSRDPEPYDRMLIRRSPGATYKNGDPNKYRINDIGESEDANDDEESSIARQIPNRMLQHQEVMVPLFTDAYASIVDRQDRIIERQNRRILELESHNDRLKDQVERALSLSAERENLRRQQEWNLKAKDEAMKFGMQIATPLVSRLITAAGGSGPPAVPLEVVTLKNFFRTTSEGGQMTEAQLSTIIGDFEGGDPNKPTKKGILTVEQCSILSQVMQMQAPVEALDALLEGEHAVTPEQALKLQQVIPLNQLAPLLILFESRKHKEPPKEKK